MLLNCGERICIFALTELNYRALLETLIRIVIEFIFRNQLLTILVEEFVYNGTSRAVVLKLVGSIEPNRCHASIHRTLNYNQERIQKILEGGCSFELG